MAVAVTIKKVKWSSSDLTSKTGLSIAETTGIISGTPNVILGTYTPTIKVETWVDAAGTIKIGEDSKTITVNIGVPTDGSWGPSITAGQVISGVVNFISLRVGVATPYPVCFTIFKAYLI